VRSSARMALRNFQAVKASDLKKKGWIIERNRAKQSSPSVYILLFPSDVEDLACHRVQNHKFVTIAIEIEQAAKIAGDGIERSVADAAKAPIVFNEPRNGRLVEDSAVHEIFPSKRRNNNQRQTRPISAAALHASE